MLLAIDAGNTNTVFAVFDGEELLGQWRISTEVKRTADEYGVWLLQILERAGIAPANVQSAIVSSVVPQILFDLRMLAKRYFDCELMIIGAPGVQPGIPVKIDRPQEVGADRVVNAMAAWKRHQTALIVVDFGTATTFDVVSGVGEYAGGVIAPGINLSLEALHRAAAKLPNVAILRPEKVIGTNTVSAMQSGIYFGYVGLIEGIISRIRAEYAKPMQVIATGGLAPLYAKATPVIEHLEPDLTIWGLKHIFELNKV